MINIEDVRTVSQFLERAADICACNGHPDPRLHWSPCSTNQILSALTHAAYPASNSWWNSLNGEVWKRDHLRLRGMDVEAQRAIKAVTQWESISANDRAITKEQACEILKAASELAA